METQNNQYNNNRTERKSVNTRAYTVSNGRAIIPSALEISYWDDMLKLSFSPELPENQKTENRRYDYKNQWVTSIPRAKVNELYNQVKTLVLPALEENKLKTVSVPLAGVNQLSISTGYRESENECRPFIALIRNIDPNTLQSNEIIMYEFAKGEFIEDYDPATGSFSGRVITNNEFDMFVKLLSAFGDASTNAYTHANRCVDRSYKDMISSNITKLGEKLGVDLTFHSNSRRDGMGYGNIFDRQNNAGAAVEPKVISMEELENTIE